jgi:hypothetical protein
MIGESVMAPPRFSLVFHRMWALVRRFATAPASERREGVEKPFPFFGD